METTKAVKDKDEKLQALIVETASKKLPSLKGQQSLRVESCNTSHCQRLRNLTP
jgi:hypothetical protein